MATHPPSQSLYLQNLPLHLPKSALRRELYTLFTTHGPVLDVNALKTTQMRGQAHILFRDVHAASQAMRGCQGMDFFGRDMRISYSKNRSNVLATLTGTVNQPASSATASGIAQPPVGFPAPPGTLPAPPGTLPAPPGGLPPPPSGLPPKVNGELKAPVKEEEVASPQGVKRSREESDEEDADAAMEEDGEEDDEGEMEMSDED